MQQATVFCAGDPTLQAEIARWAVLWCYAAVQFCSGAERLEGMAHRLLSDEEAAVFDAAPNKFNFVELKLRKLVARMKLPTDQALSVDAHIREGWRCVRACSTIKQTALPYALTLVRAHVCVRGVEGVEGVRRRRRGVASGAGLEPAPPII